MTDSAERNRTVGIEAGKAPARFRGKYLRVTSYRRDGTPVATPVWFVQDGAQLLAETGASSYKVRRIRANPAISVVACSASGRPQYGHAVTGEIFRLLVDGVPLAPTKFPIQALAFQGSLDGDVL